ncbi:putative mannosyl-oligosaccharide glucosidase [Candida viswanathii]|uniref:Mannosyl-oligosaccharide glucosidase n=1 Tax=Candida viswanathii TaxID=5486 RepID=A0A367XRJ7_9ASCO|nr:putative mannosyl-oligosaccharide glucosidase [Candida viswanathii]
MKWFWWVYFTVLIQLACSEQVNLIFTEMKNHRRASGQLGNQYAQLSNNSLLWGPTIPTFLLSGLMWFTMSDYQGVGKIRHFYEQHDKMSKANWVSYDPRIGGRQIIIDFVKSEDGLSWGVKVRAKPHKGFENVVTSFIWNVLGYDSNVKFAGVSPELGAFELEINDGPKSNKHPAGRSDIDSELDPAKSHHYSLTVPDDNVWRARDIFMTIDLQDFEGNLHFVQKVYQGACEFDIVFTNALTPATEKITFDNLNSKIKQALEEFDAKFEQKFQLTAPFTGKKYKKFAKEVLSGLLGGLSYFYGDHLVDRETVFDEDSFESYQLEGKSEGPFELFTLVPSRPFFPRGFLWDEDFHLLPLLNYDSDLVLDIVKSWFNLIDDDGWIAREQILDCQPPTLTLVLTYLLDSIAESKFGDINEPKNIDERLSKENLGRGLPEVEVPPRMFRRTQQGYGFTSRCGGVEVDLISWIGIMTRSLKMMAEIIENEEDVAKYQQLENDIIENIESLHWSPQDKTYNVFACFKGYISLFPFLTKLIPEHDVVKLQHIIDLIADPEELWSPFGIRSLSKSEELYKTGEDYWRSPIWIPINYLIEHRQQRFDQADKTGFVWEQYNDETGKHKEQRTF